MDTWEWFLTMLKENVLIHPGESEYRLGSIISDKQKGLMTAVKNVFPHTAHAYCMKHLEANLKKDYNGAYLRANL